MQELSPPRHLGAHLALCVLKGRGRDRQFFSVNLGTLQTLHERELFPEMVLGQLRRRRVPPNTLPFQSSCPFSTFKQDFFLLTHRMHLCLRAEGVKGPSKDTGSWGEPGTPPSPGQHSLWLACFLCYFPMSSALDVDEVGRSISYHFHGSHLHEVTGSGYSH